MMNALPGKAQGLCKLIAGALLVLGYLGRPSEEVTAELRDEENVETIQENCMGKNLPGGGTAYMRAQRPEAVGHIP